MANTFYSIQVGIPGQIRVFHLEGEVPESEAEVLEAVDQIPPGFRVVRIVRVDADVPPQDVTEDIWRAAEKAWHGAGGEDHCPMPAFIRDHAPAEYDAGYRAREAA